MKHLKKLIIISVMFLVISGAAIAADTCGCGCGTPVITGEVHCGCGWTP